MATVQRPSVAAGKENVPAVAGESRKRKMVKSRLEEGIPLKVKRLSKNASLPKRGSPGAAGYDIAR